ncbi:GNAT family N-acetyltransferase [Pseudidiomarina homiensis]|uniref:GNAT family N-acetyltransferase n=1 Tax=Pseudidiomarina homiensis TaxID=364198 RepID=UPI00215A3050|nr:GNAT family N-acetyltransferase [Pseudidiomarina homiensis]
MAIICSGSGIVLREVNIDDADFIFELYTGDDFRKTIGDRGIHSRQQAVEYIKDKLQTSYALHGFGLWILEANGEADGEVNGAAIGVCGLLQREYLPHPDLGFALLPTHYGQGFARRAAKLTLKYAAETLHLQTVLAITHPANSASQRLLQGLGFVHVEATIEPATGERLQTLSLDMTKMKAFE